MVDSGEHWTALMFAAAEGQNAIVKHLLKHGADKNLVDVDGETALIFAQKRGHVATANLLSK